MAIIFGSKHDMDDRARALEVQGFPYITTSFLNFINFGPQTAYNRTWVFTLPRPVHRARSERR